MTEQDDAQRNIEKGRLESAMQSANRDLINAFALLRQSILDDHRAGYPCVAPTFSEDEAEQRSFEARVAMADSLRSVFFVKKEDVEIPSGLLCCSPETIELARVVNAAKITLRDSVRAIKSHSGEWVMKMLSHQAMAQDSGYRTEELRGAMRRTGVGAVDLKRVYAQIRILEGELARVSWTWQRNHCSQVRMSLDDVLKEIEKLEARDSATAQAAKLEITKGGDSFIRRYEEAPQLRINYAYGQRGQLTRRSTPVSGVLLSIDKQLPKISWAKKPEPEFASIDLERWQNPMIKALRIYRDAG